MEGFLGSEEALLPLHVYMKKKAKKKMAVSCYKTFGNCNLFNYAEGY